MPASRLEQSRMPLPYDCKNSTTLIVCVAVASAAAGVVFSILLPFLGHFVPGLQYNLPAHRKTTLGRYRLIARGARNRQRRRQRKLQPIRCPSLPPSPKSDITAFSTACHSSPSSYHPPLQRSKSVIRHRRSQPEWLANANEWRRRSSAYSASVVESCQTRFGRMTLTRRSTTQMTMSSISPRISPRCSLSDPSFESPFTSSSTVTFRDPFQPGPLEANLKPHKVPIGSIQSCRSQESARIYMYEGERKFDPYPQLAKRFRVAVVPWQRCKVNYFNSETIKIEGITKSFSLRRFCKFKLQESS